jgi:flavin reductase (DIM6/NTAB) family NADH-FMN oxidoreductase RutF
MNDILFRKICGSYATGITVITSSFENTDYGFTANSFTSVSINPYLILFCLNKNASSNNALLKGNHFIINILSNSQSEICNQFANNNLSPNERFKGIKTITSKNKIKIILDSISNLSCKVKNIIDGGDHFIYIGEVVDGNLNNDREPLVYHNSMIRKII